MTINDTLSKIDKIFEDATPLATVPTEPVASGMMASVTGKLGGVWGDPKYHKYENLTDQETAKIIGNDPHKIITNGKKIMVELENAKKANSSNVEDLKSSGVKSDRVAAIVTPTSRTPIATPTAKFVEAAEKILRAAQYFLANNPRMGSEALVKEIKKSTLGRLGLPENEVNKIIALLSQDDYGIAGFMDTASKQGVVGAAAEIEKGVK